MLYQDVVQSQTDKVDKKKSNFIDVSVNRRDR
jgi:hypothetical protein